MDLFSIRAGAFIASTVGLGFVHLGVKQAIATARFHRESARAEGRIVGWVEGISDGEAGLECYRARVRFRSAKGGNITFLSSKTSFRPGRPTGGRVGVLYPPDDPKSAVVGGFGHGWGEVVTYLGFGALALGVAGLLLYANFRPDVLKSGPAD